MRSLSSIVNRQWKTNIGYSILIFIFIEKSLRLSIIGCLGTFLFIAELYKKYCVNIHNSVADYDDEDENNSKSKNACNRDINSVIFKTNGNSNWAVKQSDYYLLHILLDIR